MSLVPVAVMVDTTHANVEHVPTDGSVVKYVGGYTSGTDDIKWTSNDFARFSRCRKVRIFQGLGVLTDIHSFDEIDVEQRAVTPQFAAELVKERVAAGITWTTIYGGDAALADVAAEVEKLGGKKLFDGHLNCVLADWNLSEPEAVAKLGTHVHGMSCVGVQWASPESNPHTVVPGTELTLAQAGCDLSVVDAGWIPSGGFSTPSEKPVPEPTPAPVPKPVPVPVAKPKLYGVLVKVENGILAAHSVASVDGKTWS